MFRPFLLQLFDGKPLEELFLALKITLESRGEKRLAETAWSVQEEKIAAIFRNALSPYIWWQRSKKIVAAKKWTEKILENL